MIEWIHVSDMPQGRDGRSDKEIVDEPCLMRDKDPQATNASFTTLPSQLGDLSLIFAKLNTLSHSSSSSGLRRNAAISAHQI